MTQDFDPYHVWLGIPADEQPPNHYRMLGLTLFEDSVEAIRDAATQRIAHVRTYQLGVYRDLSQRILNELAAAKVCLSDPERKRQYDEQLRQGQTSPESDYFAVLATGSARPSALARRSSGSKHLVPTIGAGVAVALLGLALAYLSRTSSPQVVVTPASAERGKASVPPAPPASTPTAKPVEASKPEPPEPAEEKKPIAPAKKGKPLSPPQEGIPVVVKRSEPAVAARSVPEPKQENRKLPVPDDAAKELGKLALAEANKSRDKGTIQQARSAGKSLQSAEKRMKSLAPVVASLPAPKQIVNETDGSELVLVPAGRFLFGKQNMPVDLPAYYIGVYKLTNARYKKFVEATGHRLPRHWVGGGIPEGQDDWPVVEVSWHDAVAYCRWAELRLPTEREWEKAARGTDGRLYPWGNKWDETKCLTQLGKDMDKYPARTCPVNLYPNGCSPYGLYQMVGNAYEWSATKGISMGRWSGEGKRELYACFARTTRSPDHLNNNFGFRVAKSVMPSQTQDEEPGRATISPLPFKTRKWTRKDGTTFDGEFVKAEKRDDGANIITLRKPDGSEMTVRAFALSKADRKYTIQIMKARKSEDDVKFLRRRAESRKKTHSTEDDD